MNWLDRLLDTTTPLGRRSDAYRDAGYWGQCALGEANAEHPGFVVTVCGAPKDKALHRLGIAFQRAIGRRQRGEALSILLSIRRRVLALSHQSRP